MDMTLFAVGAGSALFAGLVGALIGYSIRETRHAREMAYARQGFLNREEELEKVVAKDYADNQELRQYRDAIKHTLTVNFLDDTGTALEQIDRLLAFECAQALDPAVSKPAQNLVIRAKRAHGKKLRAKHERLMQVLRDKANGYEELHRMAEEELVVAQQDLLIRSAAFRATCKDKLKLKGVRDAFKQAYWAEVSRLNNQNKETK